MTAIGNSPQRVVDMIGQFAQIERIITHAVRGTGIDDHDLVCGSVGIQLAGSLVFPSLIRVQPVDNGIALGGGRIVGREMNAIGSDAAQDLTRMSALLCKNRSDKEKHEEEAHSLSLPGSAWKSA